MKLVLRTFHQVVSEYGRPVGGSIASILLQKQGLPSMQQHIIPQTFHSPQPDNSANLRHQQAPTRSITYKQSLRIPLWLDTWFIQAAMKDSGDPPTLAESPHASLMDLETQTHDGDVSGPWSTQKPLVDDLIRISGFSINSRSLDKQSKALLLANSFGIEDLCDDDRVVLALLTIAYARFSLSQVWPIDDDDSDEAKEIALRAVGDFLVRREKPHLRERITSTCTSAAIGKVLSTLQTTRTYSPVDQIQNKIERALAWYVTGIRHPGSQMPGRFPKARSIITVRSFWDPRRFKGRQRQVERNALFTKVLRELSLRGLPFLVPWKASRGKDKRLVFSVRADVHTTLDVLNVWPTKSTTNSRYLA